MKVLFNKLKKCSKVLLTLFIISLILYTGSLIFLTINLTSLSGIETALRIIALVIFYLFLICYLIGGLIALITKRKKTFIVMMIFSILLSGVFLVASYYIDKTYNKVDNISKKYVTYTSNMIALNDTENSDIKKIGMISDKDDVEGNILAKKIMKKENISDNKIVKYDDYYEMLTDLYAKEIDAVFVTSNYGVLFSSEELFANIKNDVKVVYEYSEKMENKDKTSADTASTKKLTEPFTILLLGVDSEKDGLNANQAFNGDTLMMITFNPKTLNATMFSIPRDTYVPIACRNNAENKINSSAASGTKCVIDTIENLTDIDVDYYVKVNFKGVVDLVDALNGIDVDVPVSFCEQDSNRLFGDNEICLKPGEQTLKGEAALALSRHRKTLPLGDFQRVQHQQLVVEGIAKKAKTIRSVNDFYKILDAISKNIDTNMSTNQMLSFYNVFKKMLTTTLSGKDDFITIDHTYLTGSDLSIYNPSTRMNMYTFQYNRASLKEIVTLMKVNLGLEKADLIKNFNFSINTEYELSVAGKTGKATSASALTSEMLKKANKNTNSNTTNSKTTTDTKTKDTTTKSDTQNSTTSSTKDDSDNDNDKTSKDDTSKDEDKKDDNTDPTPTPDPTPDPTPTPNPDPTTPDTTE